jgi:hypothetical protein
LAGGNINWEIDVFAQSDCNFKIHDISNAARCIYDDGWMLCHG